MAGGVSGAVDDVEGDLADIDPVAMVQPTGRLEGLGVRESEHGALFRQGVEQKGIVMLRTFDGQAQALGENARCADVIQMAVGEGSA
jgi:hypothetical protein